MPTYLQNGHTQTPNLGVYPVLSTQDTLRLGVKREDISKYIMEVLYMHSHTHIYTHTHDRVI